MLVKIITPDQSVFEGEALSIKLPGSKGSFEVLKDHAPLISLLDTGTLSFKTANGSETRYQIEGGVVEVRKNEVIVLAEAVIG
jgi:F-type H+-transporting ATPase subunit epsilon